MNQQSNDLDATRAGVEHFETAVLAAGQIYSSVDGAIMQLTGGALISQSGAVFAQGVNDWLEEFNLVKDKLVRLQSVLQQTVTQLQANEQHNIDLANKPA